MSLASRGLRDLDDGKQKIEDKAELAQVQKQAHAVNLKSLVVALGLTAVSYLLPI